MRNKKKKKMSIGTPYKGFRLGITPKHKVNLEFLEKRSVLTALQHGMVKKLLDNSSVTKKAIDSETKKEVEIEIPLVSFDHQQRLIDLVNKPFNESKVDAMGNPWEKPKELTKEEIDKMNKDAVEFKNKKGKSRKDLEKKDG